MKKENDPFHPHLDHHMAGAQTMNKNPVWRMDGFMQKKDEPLREQELFYRATDYRGS